MDEKPSESRDHALIDPDDLFRKRLPGDISLADLAIASLQPYLDELPKRHTMLTLGSSKTDGGDFKGSIRATGKFSSKGITVTKSISTAGNSEIDGLMVVRNKTSLAGNVHIKSNAVFAGKTSINGNVEVDENIISSASITLSGHVEVKKQLITDGKIRTRGRVKIRQIQSLSSLHARGRLDVDENIRAKQFQIQGTGNIGGDINAKSVGIGRNKHLKRYMRNYELDRDLRNPVELIKYIGNLIISPIINRPKSKSPLLVEGDIIGDDIFMENVIINGDLNGRRITIGDNVIIRGKIEYSEKLVLLPKDSKNLYEITKIEADELRYLAPADEAK